MMDTGMREARQHSSDTKGPWTRWMGLGFEFGGMLAVFSFIGYKLDQTLDTSPWCLLGGFFLGLIVLLYNIFKVAIFSARSDTRDLKAPEPGVDEKDPVDDVRL